MLKDDRLVPPEQLGQRLRQQRVDRGDERVRLDGPARPVGGLVAEATRVLSLLMEFAELERLRTEKDRS